MHKIFIGGYERTGTTLMQGVLCSDENAFPVTRESKYLTTLISAYAEGVEIWRREKSIMSDYFDTVEAYAQFHKGVMDHYFSYIQNRWGNDKVVVQKHPLLTIYFPALAELYDDVRFIVMVRDPRDAIASLVSAESFNPADRNIEKILITYIQRYLTLYQGMKVLRDRILYVNYERLIMEPKAVMETLRTFTGLPLPIDPAREQWQAKRGEEVRTHTPLDSKPLSRASIGKYARVLTPQELDKIEEFRAGLNALVDGDMFLAHAYDALRNVR